MDRNVGIGFFQVAKCHDKVELLIYARVDIVGISIWQIIVLALPFFIPAILSVSILNKAGFSRWWALTLLIPLVNFFMIWVFALSKWPVHSQMSNTEKNSISGAGGSGMFCANCGKDIDAHAKFCIECGAEVNPSMRNDASKNTQPKVNQSQTSGLAITSMVLGILGIIIGWISLAIPSLLAIIFGHIARSKIRNGNGEISGDGMAITGLVTGYLVFSIVIVGGIMAIIAIPAYNNYTARAKIHLIDKDIREQATAYMANNTRLTDNASDLKIKLSATANKIIQSLTVDSGPIITVTFMQPIQGKTLIYTPRISDQKIIKWNCLDGTLENKFRPANCRK